MYHRQEWQFTDHPVKRWHFKGVRVFNVYNAVNWSFAFSTRKPSYKPSVFTYKRDSALTSERVRYSGALHFSYFHLQLMEHEY